MIGLRHLAQRARTFLRTRLAPARASRGFTLVELLIGASVALVGLFASLNMMGSAVRGNNERRDALMAQQLAQHLLATIRAESTMWIDDDIAKRAPRYIGHLPMPATAGEATPWMTELGQDLANDKRVSFGANGVYDPGMILESPQDRGTRYCAHWRLTWITPELIRAEVRVSWQRPHVPVEKYIACPSEMSNDIGNVGSITLPAMVSKNVYVQ